MPAPSGKTSEGLPFPLETDGVDPPRDIKALAEFLNKWEPPGTLPIGSEAEWAGQNDPNAKWMVEDGRELSRTTYKALFEAISTTYGIGDGSTTFNIPDSRGRVSVGAGKGAGLTNRLRGEKTGEETHTLTIAEMPSHSHSYGNLVETEVWLIPFEPGGSGGYPGGVNFAPIRHGEGYNNGFFTIWKTGGNAAHNNMQPYIVKNKIIRVL